MSIANNLINAFNRGIISKRALARIDLKRTALSAEIQTNWMPRTLGSMSLRPGLGYIDSTYNNLKAHHIPFIYSSTDNALLEFTDQSMRVRINEVVLARAGVSTSIVNGNFDNDLSGWTDADESGASSDWINNGYMGLTGSGVVSAIRTQQVFVIPADIGAEHALRIVVERGPIKIRVGASPGSEEYIREATLRTGTYSLAFNPLGDFHIWVFNSKKIEKRINSIQVDTPGDMVIPTPWLEGDLGLIRTDQSGDVVFVACSGYSQYRIERYASRSWGVAKYEPDNGSFRAPNISTTTLTPSALTGNIALTASFRFFDESHAGALFRITSIGQSVELAANGDGQWSDPIQITGVGASRLFNIYIAGTWVGTVTLQRSVGEIGSWVDTGESYAANGTYPVSDGLDNQIIFYRVGFSTGWDSGTANLGMTYSSGGLTGIARVTRVQTPTIANAEVLTPFGAITPSVLWSEGAWSEFRGYPSAVTFYEGRLWWAGKDKIWGSVSDGFENFDDTTEGDSAPISRSLGSGPVDRINWLLPLQRLAIGTDMAERSARSSSLDEPLTVTNFNLKSPSTRGGSPVSPVIVDTNGLFVRKNKLFQLSYTGGEVDFASEDMTQIAPEVGDSGFARIAVQRYPDTRIHCVRNDGTAAVLIYDPLEGVKCWILVETDGYIEDVVVLPDGEQGSASDEDKVYYVVKRTINGAIVRYLEKWALESECIGGYSSKLADSFVASDDWIYPGYSLTPSATTGTITLIASGAYWTSGYIGQIVRINGGRATITAYSSSISVTATVTAALDNIATSEAGDWSHAAATTTLTGLEHLEGETVVAWADGVDVGTKTVINGTITLATAAADRMAGLGYTARYKSTKLAYASGLGTALNQVKRVNYLGLIMMNTHAQGLRYGANFIELDDLPLMEEGLTVNPDSIWEDYDFDAIAFDGDYSTDSRICLEAAAPRPATVLACVVTVKTSDKA